MGMVTVASFGATGYSRAPRDDDVYLKTHELSQKRSYPVSFSLRKSPLDDNVFPLNISKLVQSLPKRLGPARRTGKGGSS
jgi:hypothetical protein